MCKRIVSIAIIFAAVLVCLNLLTPLVYRTVPNDYLRTGLILTELEKDDVSPAVLVFGNSRGMSGIDCRRIETAIGETVYNCCSASQSIIESAMFYDRIPESVHTVIQCIDEREFTEGYLRLSEPAMVSLSMFGYRPDSLAAVLLHRDDMARLTECAFRKNFRARMALKSGLSHIIIAALDDDAPSDNIYDMKTPYIYPSDSSKTYQRDLDLLRQYAPHNGVTFPVSDVLKDYFSKVGEYFTKRDIRVIYVLMPVSPALGWDDVSMRNKTESVRLTVSPSEFVDCLGVSDAGGFYDPVHPNRKGAVVITDTLIDYLLAGKN